MRPSALSRVHATNRTERRQQWCDEGGSAIGYTLRMAVGRTVVTCPGVEKSSITVGLETSNEAPRVSDEVGCWAAHNACRVIACVSHPSDSAMCNAQFVEANPRRDRHGHQNRRETHRQRDGT